MTLAESLHQLAAMKPPVSSNQPIVMQREHSLLATDNATDDILRAQHVFQELKLLVAKAKSVPLQKGISFLNVKMLILVETLRDLQISSLLQNIAYPVLQHSGLVKQLLFKKALLSRLEPLEAKMSYELDKMVKISSMQQELPSHDPMLLKPRPELLVGESVQKGQHYGAVRIESELPPTEQKAQQLKSKEKRQMSYLRQKYLQQQVEEEHEFKAIGFQQTPWERRKREYQESHFERLAETRMDKKMRRRREEMLNKDSTQGGMLSDMVDFSEAKKMRKAFGLNNEDQEKEEGQRGKPKIVKDRKFKKAKRKHGDY